MLSLSCWWGGGGGRDRRTDEAKAKAQPPPFPSSPTPTHGQPRVFSFRVCGWGALTSGEGGRKRRQEGSTACLAGGGGGGAVSLVSGLGEPCWATLGAAAIWLRAGGPQHGQEGSLSCAIVAFGAGGGEVAKFPSAVDATSDQRVLPPGLSSAPSRSVSLETPRREAQPRRERKEEGAGRAGLSHPGVTPAGECAGRQAGTLCVSRQVCGGVEGPHRVGLSGCAPLLPCSGRLCFAAVLPAVVVNGFDFLSLAEWRARSGRRSGCAR